VRVAAERGGHLGRGRDDLGRHGPERSVLLLDHRQDVGH
jgi:hypothetical protein